MQSNCGVDSVEKTSGDPDHDGRVAGRRAASGARPSSGELIGEPNVLALDIGGTTAKCSLIEGGHVQDHVRLLDRARPPLGRLSDHGAGRRPRRDRQRRRLHRLGRRLRQAARRPAVGGRDARARRRTAAAAPRRRRPTPTSRSAASTPTTSAAARSTPTWTRSSGRSARSPGKLGVDRAEAARGIVRIANNNMINALKLVSRQPRATTRATSRSSPSAAAAAMHAVALAAELGIRKVVDPARGRRVLAPGGC